MKKFYILFIIVFVFSIKINLNASATDYARKTASSNYLDPLALSIDSQNSFQIDKLIPLKENSTYVIIGDKNFFGSSNTNEDFEFITAKDNTYNPSEFREYCSAWNESKRPSYVYSTFDTRLGDFYFTTLESLNISATTSLEDARKAIGIYKYSGDIEDYLNNTYRGFVDFIDSTNYRTYIQNYHYYLVSSAANPISIEDIKKMIYIKDNQSDNTANLLSIITDNYSLNSSKVGQYNITLEASDQSLNTTKIQLIIIVADTLSPSIIKKTEKIQIKLSDCNSSIFDTVYSLAFEITDDNLFSYSTYGNETKESLYVIGNHIWAYQIKDIYDNTSVAYIDVEIIDDISPDIYMDKFILDHPSYIVMSDDQIVSYIKNYLTTLNINAENISIIKNEYKNNLEVEGLYTVLYKYELNDKTIIDSLSLNVHPTKYQTSKEETEKTNKSYIYIASSFAVVIVLGATLFIINKKRN